MYGLTRLGEYRGAPGPLEAAWAGGTCCSELGTVDFSPGVPDPLGSKRV